jgi:hypothetical protein
VATLVIAGLLMLAGLRPAATQSQQVDGLIEGPPIQGDNDPVLRSGQRSRDGWRRAREVVAHQASAAHMGDQPWSG